MFIRRAQILNDPEILLGLNEAKRVFTASIKKVENYNSCGKKLSPPSPFDEDPWWHWLVAELCRFAFGTLQ